MDIEIVIPILNEEKTLTRQIIFLKDYLTKVENYGHNVLITITDNGSTDRSAEIGTELANSINGIRFIQITEPGVGRALKRSWANSEAEIIGFMDLDLATDLKHLDMSWTLLEQNKYDIVCGTRNKKDSKVINRSCKRTVISKTLNLLIKLIFHTEFTDGMCGFKFLRTECLPLILENGIGFDDWFFSTEILIIAESINLRIYDMPVTWRDSRESKVKIFQLTKIYMANMFRLKSILPVKNKSYQ